MASENETRTLINLREMLTEAAPHAWAPITEEIAVGYAALSRVRAYRLAWHLTDELNELDPAAYAA